MEAVAETGRLFVRNLPFTATEEEVAAHFAKHGALTAVHVIVDRTTRASKGLAYITYALPENATTAMREMDGSIFQGRLIHLLPAKRPPSMDATMGGIGRDGIAGADGAGSRGGRRRREKPGSKKTARRG
jgi:multiple RNA-binding domain-containing protein 1